MILNATRAYDSTNYSAIMTDHLDAAVRVLNVRQTTDTPLLPYRLDELADFKKRTKELLLKLLEEENACIVFMFCTLCAFFLLILQKWVARLAAWCLVGKKQPTTAARDQDGEAELTPTENSSRARPEVLPLLGTAANTPLPGRRAVSEQPGGARGRHGANHVDLYPALDQHEVDEAERARIEKRMEQLEQQKRVLEVRQTAQDVLLLRLTESMEKLEQTVGGVDVVKKKRATVVSGASAPPSVGWVGPPDQVAAATSSFSVT